MGVVILKILFTISVFLYLFAYGIKIAGVPVTVLISIASMLYIILNRLLSEFIKIWLVEIALVVVIFCYLLLVEAVQGVPLSIGNFSFYVIRILIDGILPAYVLSEVAKKSNINISEFVYILFLLIIVELIFSTMMIFMPNFKNNVFLYVNDYDGQSVLLNEELFFKRGFGIAYTYLAWFPFAMALIFSFCLFSDVIKSKIILFLLVISTFILIVLNARIGFIPLFFGMLFYAFFNGIRGAKKIISLALIIGFTFYVFSMFDVGEKVSDLVEFFGQWVIDDGFASLYSQQGSETVKDLSNFQILSDFGFSDFVFGRGGILVPENGNLYTDVGYMQILYTGGLLLSFSLYALFVLFAMRLIKYVRVLRIKGVIPKVFIYFPFVVCISFLIAHGKLRIFEMNEATRFILLIISLFIVFSGKSSVLDKLSNNLKA